MKTLIAAIVFVGAAVLLLGVNIFFFHRPFPDGEISTNPALRSRGIRCVKEEEMALHGKKKKAPEACDGQFSDACRSCALYEYEKK